MSDPFTKLTRLLPSRSTRHRLTSWSTAAGLALMMALVLLTPRLQQIEPGPTEVEVALQSERARADDLKAQLAQAEARLSAPRPPPTDVVDAERARADDLRAQLRAVEAKLSAPRGMPTEQIEAERARAEDLKSQLGASQARLRAPRPLPQAQIDAERARADDLAAQLTEAETLLAAPRPVPESVLAEERARADDLKAQVDDLSNRLEQPRVVPPRVITASMTRDQISAARGLFGLYTVQSPFDNSEFSLVEDAVDRDAQVSGYFQSWETGFRADAVQAAWARDEIPLLTWESQAQVGTVTRDDATYSLPKIIGGDFDPYLRQYARDITATGLPLVIRLNHEMNGNWYPWSEVDARGQSINGNSKGDYAKMWRHVHDIFEAEGANEYVVWLWAPNRVNRIPGMPAPEQFYPGDEYVDWVGMSGYYRPYDESPTFEETYGRTLPLLRDAGPGKPIFLAEIGATEDKQQKAVWIDSLFEGMAANEDIIGFAWFSLAVTSGTDATRTTNDWRVNSSGSSERALEVGLAEYDYGRPR